MSVAKFLYVANSICAGLVLTGGGARAAYQVGVLRALADITRGESTPFRIVTGVSAGAINTYAVAAHADDFATAVESLSTTWRTLSPENVYRTDARSLFSIGARWIGELSGGGLLGAARSNHLLDTSPLRALLHKRLANARIQHHLATGRLRGVALTATNYETGTAITFYDGADDIEPWTRSSRIGRRESLTVDHVLASSAIPIFFPPVRIGSSFYGDGCIRLNAPISPAIHLGADRVLAVGIRYLRSGFQLSELNGSLKGDPLSLAEIGGVLLNAVFLDSLESDVERLERINATLSLISPEQRTRLSYPLRKIPILVMRPSRDLGRLAARQSRRFPRTLRYLLRGIGATGERGWDLLSYLAFEPTYVSLLMELGFYDTLTRRAEVEAFFEARALAA
jgi:NTE family protein